MAGMLRLTPLNRALLLTLIAVTSIIPFIVLSVSGVVDPFTGGQVASSIRLVNGGSLPSQGSSIQYTPANGVLLAALSFVSGVPLTGLAYFPIAGLFGVLSVFALGRKLLGDSVSGMLAASVVAYRFFSPFAWSVWPHTFGYSLFLLFVLLFFRYSNSRNFSVLILLWLIFLGTHFYSYNAELWIIAFLVFAEVGRLLARWWASKGTLPGIPRLSAASLLAATLVTFLGFNEVIYGLYIPKFVAVEAEWTVTFRYYLSTIFRTASPIKFAYVPPPTPPVLFGSNVGWLTLAFAPIVLGIAVVVRTRMRLGRLIPPGSRYRTVLFGAFGAVWLADAASYLPIGAATAATFRYPTLVVPLISPIAVVFLLARRRLPKRVPTSSVISIYLAVLCLLAASAFGLTLAGGYWVTSSAHYSDVDPGATWLRAESPGTRGILSDQDTQGEYAIVYAYAGIAFPSENFYTSDSFSQLVSPSVPPPGGGFFHASFVVINVNLANTSTMAGGWVNFQPIAPYLSLVNNNPQLSRVYDDGNSWILSGV